MPAGNLTKILISFGAISGGFEFALQLRRDLMKHFGARMDHPANSHFVYIDAISLEGDKETHYSWNDQLGIFKMSNGNWEGHYKTAISECEAMIFILTEPWLKSSYCWEELEWYKKALLGNTNKIKPLFILFKDAKKILDENKPFKIEDKRTSSGTIVKHPKDINRIFRLENTVEINANSEAPGRVTAANGRYEYKFKYACSSAELVKIIKVLENTL